MRETARERVFPLAEGGGRADEDRAQPRRNGVAGGRDRLSGKRASSMVSEDRRRRRPTRKMRGRINIIVYNCFIHVGCRTACHRPLRSRGSSGVEATTAIRLSEDSTPGRTPAARANSEVRSRQREAQRRTTGVTGRGARRQQSGSGRRKR